MTAADMIARLQQVPPETPVFIHDNWHATEPELHDGKADLSESKDSRVVACIFIDSTFIKGRDADGDVTERTRRREVTDFLRFQQYSDRAQELDDGYSDDHECPWFSEEEWCDLCPPGLGLLGPNPCWLHRRPIGSRQRCDYRNLKRDIARGV